MIRSKRGLHLLLLLIVMAALAAIPLWKMGNPSSAPAESGASSTQPDSQAPMEEDTDVIHIYLLIGSSNMAGLAEIPENAITPIERCFLLNENNEWEPASSPLNRHSTIDPEATSRKLGPGHSFAKSLLSKNPDLKIGLVVNAGADSGIEEWLGKSKLYWGARGRTKAAMREGVLKGVLWVSGKTDSESPEGYQQNLKSLVGNLRSDFDDPNLPFVIAGTPGSSALNAEIAKLIESDHAAAFVSTEDLSSQDGFHFDTRGQLALGERFAETMLKLRAQLPTPPKPPTDLQFIDPHVHAMSVTPLGLRSVAKWMEERNVSRCIVSPLNHKGSRAWTGEEREQMLENFRPYQGRIDRMCIIDAGEVETVAEAVTILEREIASGAVGFGEHYGRNLMFDDPQNLLLYEACEKTALPVMFHIDQNKNMVTPGMPEVDRVLKKFPKCDLVAHAYWWRQLQSGACDRQLQEHPNLYADMSGHVVINVLNRDRKYAREFLIRNQDKILWATDEGWWSFGSREKQMNQHYTFLEGLDLPDEVRRKIYRENAEKVYRLHGSVK